MIKPNREYRIFQTFDLIPNDENKAYAVRGRAVVFDSPTLLGEFEGVKYYEIVDSNAFDGCDMSDVIFNYNHGGKVVARLRNKTLNLDIVKGDGLYITATLSGTDEGRRLYEEIAGGYIDRMSFSFSQNFEFDYDTDTKTRKITAIKKLFDVSAVDIPAYEETSIAARGFFEEAHLKELRAVEDAHRRKMLIVKTYF